MAKLEALTKEDFRALIPAGDMINEPYFEKFVETYKKTDFKKYEKATFKNGCSVVILSMDHGYFAFVDEHGDVKAVRNIYESRGLSYDTHLDIVFLQGHEEIILMSSDGYISLSYG